MIHEVYSRVAQMFRREGVWQIVPPQDYKDRLASAGAPATPPGGYPVTDHGGSVIAAPKLALVYLGAWWGDAGQLEQFASDLMTCGFLDPCAMYGVNGPFAYLGAWLGPKVSGPTITDAQLRSLVAALPQFGIPAPDGSTLYALILPDGVTVTEGADASCSAFCGYHDALSDGQTFYSVHPSTLCNGCDSGEPFASFTMVLAHEVAEWATDAVPGLGWYNDETGMEISDEWAWIAEPYGPWTVQGYEVNGVGDSYGEYNSQPAPPPGPDIAGALAQLQVAQLAINTATGLLGG